MLAQSEPDDDEDAETQDDAAGDRSFHDVNELASSVEIDLQGDRAVSEALAEDTAVFRLSGDDDQSSVEQDDLDADEVRATDEPEDSGQQTNATTPELEEAVDASETSNGEVDPKPDMDGDDEAEEKETTPEPQRTPTPEPAPKPRGKARSRVPVTPPRRVLRSRKDPIEQFETPMASTAPSPAATGTATAATPKLKDNMRTRAGKTPQPASSTDKAMALLESVKTQAQAKESGRRGPLTRARSVARQTPAPSSSKLRTPLLPPVADRENPLYDAPASPSARRGKKVTQSVETTTVAVLDEDPNEVDAATPLAKGPATPKPLFIATGSQSQHTFPLSQVSQWAPKKPGPNESEDESDEEDQAKRARPRPSTQQSFRRLTDMVASQEVPFRSSNLSGVGTLGKQGKVTEKDLFGQTGSDSDDSDEDSDSSEDTGKAGPSHIPQARRASARFT